MIIFNSGFSTKVACVFILLENIKDLSEFNTFNLHNDI